MHDGKIEEKQGREAESCKGGHEREPQRGQIQQLSGKRTEHRLPGSRTLPGSLLVEHPHGHTSQC